MKRMKRRLMWILPVIAAVLAFGWLVYSRCFAPDPFARLRAAAERLDEIIISAEMNAQERSFTISQTLKLTNRTGEKQDAAVLRTWVNAFRSMDTSPCAQDDGLYALYYPDGFSAGAMVMGRVQVNGNEVLHRYTDEAKPVLSIPVPDGWEPNETIMIDLDYVIHMPQMAYRFGVQNDIWALGNAFAIPAVWQDGAFRTDAYAAVGDPFVSDCANYQVYISVPDGYVCAGSSKAEETSSRGMNHYAFTASAVRDFALVIGRFEKAQAKQDGVLVTAYAQTASQAREMLRYGRKALACFNEAYGDYPYPAYTLAEVDLPHGGMEYPGLSMISSALLKEGGRELEYTVAHETAHQWWYAAVGSDSWRQAWQDEALAEFSLLHYAESRYGRGEREDLERSRMESSLRVTVPRGITPGAPLDYFDSMSQYRLLVYDRGAACLCALDRTVPLDGFLREYYRTYAFKRASREDFEQLLLQSTGEDLSPLMRDYLDTAILN